MIEKFVENTHVPACRLCLIIIRDPHRSLVRQEQLTDSFLSLAEIQTDFSRLSEIKIFLRIERPQTLLIVFADDDVWTWYLSERHRLLICDRVIMISWQFLGKLYNRSTTNHPNFLEWDDRLSTSCTLLIKTEMLYKLRRWAFFRGKLRRFTLHSLFVLFSFMKWHYPEKWGLLNDYLFRDRSICPFGSQGLVHDQVIHAIESSKIQKDGDRQCATRKSSLPLLFEFMVTKNDISRGHNICARSNQSQLMSRDIISCIFRVILRGIYSKTEEWLLKARLGR